MIYLITGGMGTGKTSMVVDMIMSNYEGLFKMESDDGTKIDRPLYFCHIDGLDARKFKAHELTEEEIQSAPLRELLPQGSVLIVDECDYTYPVRPAGRDAPPYVKTLKEMRHDGLTLILMTQHPSMIDKYVRNLVNKHIHLERKQIGTMRYEWFRCEESIGPAAFETGAGRFYSPPKAAFDYYKSSSKHIDFKKKRHPVFYILPLLLLLFIWRGIVFWGSFGEKAGFADADVESHAVSQNSGAVVPFEAASAPMSEAASVPMGGKIEDYIPRIIGLPETRPIYDGLRQPLNMETIAGCVASASSCNCYTEQATLTYVEPKLCRYYAENGVFQRYKPMGSVGSSVLPSSASVK